MEISPEQAPLVVTPKHTSHICSARKHWAPENRKSRTACAFRLDNPTCPGYEMHYAPHWVCFP